MLLLVVIQSRFNEFPNLPDDVGKGQNETEGNRSPDVCRELPRHGPALNDKRDFVDAQSVSTQTLRNRTQKAIREEGGVLRSEQDLVEDEILHYKGDHSKGHNGQRRP